MSSTTNIPINTRSMNGIITISDGIATMENGNLTDVNTLDANTTNSTIMTTTTQPVGTSNTTVATTAFVNNNLTGYAKLNPTSPQTFTGSHNFPTQLTTDNSTLVATTAYVKNQGYAVLNPTTTQIFTGTNTFAALNANTPTIGTNSTRVATTAYVKSNLLNYGLLAPGTAQTFSGENIFDTLRATTPATSTNSTIVATTAYVKSNLANYVTTNTTQSITGNKTFDGTTTLNNLFVSNYVDLTLTTYENQFFGDIYGYRGIVCQNGLYIKDSPGPGATTYALIDTSGNISTTSNISAASITLPNNSINDSYLTTNIPLKNGTNTFTGVNTFNATTFFNAIVKNTQSIQVVYPGDFRMLDSTQTFLTQMYQNGTTCSIEAAFASSRLRINTRTALNVGLNNLLIENGNRVVLQGSSGGLEIDITGTAITLNGICSFTNATTPTISSTIPTPDNSTKIATTAFVKAQSYLTTANAATLYALINPSTQTFTGNNNFPTQAAANNSTLCATTAFVKNQGYALNTATQTFTGQQTFTAIIPTAPILIKNTTSTKSGGFIISGNTSYNSINNTDDFAVIAFGSGVDTGILNLTTWAAGSCGIKIDKDSIKFNAGLTCNYNTLSPVPALGVFDIGYNWIVAGSTFTNWVANTGSSPGNVVTIAFDGTGNKQKGTWLVDIVLSTGVVSAPQSFLIWTTVGAANGVYNDTCCHSNDYGLYNNIGNQALRMSFVLIVTTTPTTYYLNYNRIGGSGLTENKTNSKISFTRMG